MQNHYSLPGTSISDGYFSLVVIIDQYQPLIQDSVHYPLCTML